ncbi:MAG: PilT/PilU family type 4a pilus ATPase [Armatimonadota bacterium]
MPLIESYLKEAIDYNASDLHLCSDSSPAIRIYGKLIDLHKNVLHPRDVAVIVNEILTSEQKECLDKRKDIDFAYEVSYKHRIYRFRCHVLVQKYGFDCYLRIVPCEIKSLKELNLPENFKEIVRYKQGLILVTGPVGSGKSTTLAALIDIINKERDCHIITIEDPVEYIHKSRRSLVTHKNLNIDIKDYSTALLSAMREDPDVILVGELRDSKSIQAAISAAETGHLVFGTLHTANSIQTVERIVNTFPPVQRPLIRIMLSETLKGVVSQVLLPRTDVKGLIPAVEVLVGCHQVSTLIRDEKTYQIPSVMQTNRHLGMRTLDYSLAELIKEKKISKQDAYAYATDKEAIDGYIK